MRQIYISGKFESQERLRHERDRIHATGAGKVVGTWLDEEPQPCGGALPRQAREYAIRDCAEIDKADLLILDTKDENIRGGREVEYGYALGRNCEVWIVGPKRNVFHEFAPCFFSWDDALDALIDEEDGNR